MDRDIRTLVAAGALAGALGFGGASLAGAQEATDDTTTTTVAPDGGAGTDDDATAEDHRGDGCDEGDGGSASSSDEGTSG